jgi:hypothetical protein
MEGRLLPWYVKATVSGHQVWRASENRSMVGHRPLEFVSLTLARRQDPVACDDSAFDLIKHEVPSKLDRCPWLLALEHAGMRLE